MSTPSVLDSDYAIFSARTESGNECVTAHYRGTDPHNHDEWIATAVQLLDGRWRVTPHAAARVADMDAANMIVGTEAAAWWALNFVARLYVLAVTR